MKWSIYALQKNAKALDYSATHAFVKELEREEFVVKNVKTNEFQLTKVPDLIKQISLFKPIASRKKEYFYSGLDLTKKIKFVKLTGLKYALTVFGASELLHPYIKTNLLHLYVNEKDINKWVKKLTAKNVLKSDKASANTVLLPVTENIYFDFNETVNGFKLAPFAVLIADLLSFSGLGEEQANFILKKWLAGRI
ncbi:MAG: hypothetical protein ABH821_04140 [archaeon]